MSSLNEVAGSTPVAGLPPPKITFKENKKLYLKNMFKNLGKSIWNNKKKRFLGRDGEDWSEFKKNIFKTVQKLTSTFKSVC